MPSSHYHAYYKQQVEARKGQAGAGVKRAKTSESSGAAVGATMPTGPSESPAGIEEQEPRVPRPTEQHFILTYPESVSAEGLEVMKLVAQYVAVNGPAWQQALSNREGMDSALLGFVETTHAHHGVYSQLLDQYARVLQRSKAEGEGETTVAMLGKETRASIMARVVARTEWEREEREARQRAEQNRKRGAAEEEEAAAVGEVDWDDFLVVQTILFQENAELLPPPLTLAQLKALAALKDRQATAEAAARAVGTETLVKEDQTVPIDEIQKQELAEESESQSYYAAKASQSGIAVVADYQPGAGTTVGVGVTRKCPICGLEIPVAEIEQHIKIETMSKRHIEHLAETAQGRKSAMAPDDEIAANIKSFSRVRTDIFDTGSAAPEALLQKKRKVEEQSAGVVRWDGHSDSVDTAVNLEAQISRIHATKGSSHNNDSPAIGPLPGHAARAVAQAKAQEEAELAASKNAGSAGESGRALSEATEAPVDEAEWAASHPGPFGIHVVVVAEEVDPSKSWTLDGRTVRVEADANMLIEQIKQRLESEIALPVNLMKLQHSTYGFLKNQGSCASYNLADGDCLELTRQQRGGRKK